MLLKGAKESDLLQEITLANMEIRRGEGRRDIAQKALETLQASGESYVGENEDKEEAKRAAIAAKLAAEAAATTQSAQEAVATSAP